MRTNKLNLVWLFLALIVAMSSCKEDEIIDNPTPVEIDANNQWLEGEIENDEILWYRVNCDAGSTTAYLEWAEISFLVKVLPTTAGSFALRAKATSVVSVEYTDLNIADAWTNATIAQDEILGYKVKYSGAKKLAIIWAEVDSPESGYTADVMVSVLHADGETIYKDVDKNKDMLDKNKSHSDDPKFIMTNGDDNNLKIHVKNTIPGTFAIKVIEVNE